jgi:hypothetical protein
MIQLSARNSARARAVLLLLVLGMTLTPVTVRAADTAAVPALSVAPPAAHWVERKFDYTYMGFTTHYSCDGLVDNVREVLVALGARKQDLQIHSSGCTRLTGAPEPFPGVLAHFWVLEPLTPEDIGKVGNTTAVPTQWRTVDLTHLKQFRSDQGRGQCELLEQLQKKALPLFTTRNLTFSATCTPHEITLGNIRFSVDVLRPAPPSGAVVPASSSPPG